ncbi:hypothetical protein ACQPZU_10755 [Saccharomonospora azurea]|uniref:hypothetical protein n=1 Tax=Saccharomonospora azurea TaxID=40988 RepID=UPI003D8B5DAA
MPEKELVRTRVRPRHGPLGPLATFYIEVNNRDEIDDFTARVRELVRAGVEVSLAYDFDADELPEDLLPAWMEEESASGQRRDAETRYVLHRGPEKWATQDLLFSFDPKQRSWEWWDATQANGNVVQVWVDSGGEPVFQCEELRWICYLSGARSIVGPLLVQPAEWDMQRSVGVSSD